MLLQSASEKYNSKVVIKNANTINAEIKSPEWVPLFIFGYIEELREKAFKHIQQEVK